VDRRGGIDAFLLEARDAHLSDRALRFKRMIQKKQQAAAA
jgi:hypothetical protein